MSSSSSSEIKREPTQNPPPADQNPPPADQNPQTTQTPPVDPGTAGITKLPQGKSYADSFIDRAQLLVIPLFPVSVTLGIFLVKHPTIKVVPVEFWVSVALYICCLLDGTLILYHFERAKKDPGDSRWARFAVAFFHLSAVTATGVLLIRAFIFNDFGLYLKYLLGAVDVVYLLGCTFSDILRRIPKWIVKAWDKLKGWIKTGCTKICALIVASPDGIPL